jgi:surface antigen
MTYQDFKKKWIGGRVDYDHVYAYQCVDLILQYIYECFGIASGVWGNAIDYWNHPQNALLAKFDKISTTDCQQGDIVVFRGLSGNPYGHIGICESQDSTNVTILEQNGAGGSTGQGRDAIELRAIPKTRIAGVLRPKGAAVPAPKPGTGRVVLPGSVRTWRLYRVGSGLRPNTSDQIAVLAPSQYGGLEYPIDAWVGDYAVVITTQMFGRGTIWVKGTEAQFK